MGYSAEKLVLFLKFQDVSIDKSVLHTWGGDVFGEGADILPTGPEGRTPTWELPRGGGARDLPSGG